MERTRDTRVAAGRYRTEYLRLRSALFDRATGLPAVPVLFDRLRGWLDTRRRIGLLLIEIDHLRFVESLYGWQVLDRVLARVAGELAAALGEEIPTGSEVALSGVAGDRFAVFVPDRPDGGEVDGPFLERAGERLCRRLEQAFGGAGFAGLSPRPAFRAGHALVSRNPFYRFERRVWSALDEARAFHQRRDRRRELSWGEELQRIIHDSAVDTVFQPVVDLRSRALLGYEAFSRGPKDSPLEMPQALFAMSERFGVTRDLDRLCRERALRASCGIAEAGTRLFINVRPLGLEELCGPVSASADEAAPNAELVLELSERVAQSDTEGFLASLSRLKERGYRIALDDVGTGYASQAILEEARPDYLKLDVSLVRNIHEHLIKQELLHSLVRIADRIGASVIAEGVESEEEAATLLRAGARYAQGFLFAQPAPAAVVGLRRRGPEAGH